MKSIQLTRILFIALMFTTVLTACKKKDSPASAAANEITDATELEVYLSWSLTDNSTATTSADLDLYLFKGNITLESQLATLTPTATSDNSDNFETIALASSAADGQYTIVLDYFEILKAGKYTLRFKGTGSGKIYNVADVSFTVAEDGKVKLPVLITKAGQKFTVTKK